MTGAQYNDALTFLTRVGPVGLDADPVAGETAGSGPRRALPAVPQDD